MQGSDTFYRKYSERHLDHHLNGLEPTVRDHAERLQVEASTKPASRVSPRVTSDSGSRGRWLVALLALAVLGCLGYWLLRPNYEVSTPPGPPKITGAVSSEIAERHWPYGPLPAERIIGRRTYVLGMSDQRSLPRWAAFRIEPGSCQPSSRLDPEVDAVYRDKIEGYLKGNLIPPALVCGGTQAEKEVGYRSLDVPMTRALNNAWRRLPKLAGGFSHGLIGPLLDEPSSMRAGVPIPKRYFVILAGDRERKGFWFYNETGRYDAVDVAEIQRVSGLSFFDE